MRQIDLQRAQRHRGRRQFRLQHLTTNDRVGNTLDATAAMRARPLAHPEQIADRIRRMRPRSRNSPSRSKPATNINKSYSHWRRKTW